MTHNLDVNVRLFADDCMIYRDIKNEADQITLNNATKEIATSCNNWQMVLNLDKTFFVYVTKKKTMFDYPYTYNNIAYI